jgi:ABC-type multidrug transport system fused ATPase/permease subunit
MRELRDRFYSHLQTLPLAFFTGTKTGEIQSRLANDVDRNSAAAEGPIWRSASFGGGFILLDYAGRDAAALAQLNSLGLCPGPDVSAALPGC